MVQFSSHQWLLTAIAEYDRYEGWGREPLDLVWIVEGLLQAESEYRRAREG